MIENGMEFEGWELEETECDVCGRSYSEEFSCEYCDPSWNGEND